MFQTIEPKKLANNVFSMLDDQWTLISAGTEDKFNAMTASWGGLGVLFHKPVATIYVRPQRYTKEFIEANDAFTLSFFGEEYRKTLAYFGSKSGREVDKVKETGLTPAMAGEKAPYFEEADLVLVCKKLYYDDFKPEQFTGVDLEEFYPQKDYHRLYIGEITKVLVRA